MLAAKSWRGRLQSPTGAPQSGSLYRELLTRVVVICAAILSEGNGTSVEGDVVKPVAIAQRRQEVLRPLNTSKTFGFTTLMGLPAA